MATIITLASNADASGVIAPRTSSNPKTNSTVETKAALNSGKGTCALINVWRISFRRSGTKNLARPDRKTSKPTARRARKMPSHSNECSSLTKIRAHDIDQRVKCNSRAVNEIERLTRGSQQNWERECFLQPICFAATNLLGEKTLCQN